MKYYSAICILRLIHKFRIHAGILFLLVLCGSCTKFVQVDPPDNSLTGSKVFANPTSASAAVSNIYVDMVTNTSQSICGYGSVAMGLSSDELVNLQLDDEVMSRLYKNELLSDSYKEPGFWVFLYNLIYQTNSAINGINAATFSGGLKQQLSGEVHFLRAFFYFYLVNLYGDAPLILTPNYLDNSIVKRTPRDSVFSNIISDLVMAKQLLTDNYLDFNNANTSERARPNRGAAIALLARVYLYLQEWPKAEAEASLLIEGNNSYKICDSTNSVFLMNSTEAIWQIRPVVGGYNSIEATYFIPDLSSSYFTRSTCLNKDFVRLFQENDRRYINWIGKFNSSGDTIYYPNKYKIYANGSPVSEYQMVLRLSEQYLIRAEARARQSKFSLAIQDINVLHKRANISEVASISDIDQLINIIGKERQFELFTEWGDRWLNMKRLGTIDAIMSSEAPKKGGKWDPGDKLYPLPAEDILKNSNLTQNFGY